MRSAIRPLSLLLPALIPSWRFFSEITPSARIQYTIIQDEACSNLIWHEFNLRPQTLSFGQMLLRLFWNPHWNETLFLVTCAERICASDDPISVQRAIAELRTRIHQDLTRQTSFSSTAHMCFRLAFVHRDGTDLINEVHFTSPPYPLGGEP